MEKSVNRVDARILEQLETLNRNIAKITECIAGLKRVQGRRLEFAEDDLSEFAEGDGPLGLIFTKLTELRGQVTQLHADLRDKVERPQDGGSPGLMPLRPPLTGPNPSRD